MKKMILCALVALFASAVLNAQSVEGKWKLDDGTSIVEVYPAGNAYNAKIVWLNEPNGSDGQPLKDVKNPDAALKTRPVLGLNILNDLKFDGKRYSGGSIYDPGNGKTYKCTMEINPKDSNDLIVKGYVGPFSRAMHWLRVVE